MTPSPAVLAELREITMAFAARHGDAHPTHLRMVETTETALAALCGVDRADLPPPTSIYIVIAEGHFMFSRPGATVRGTRIFMQIRRSDLDFIGVGVDLIRDLSPLGTFTDL